MPSLPPSRLRDQADSRLIEVLVVILIVGALAAIAIPSFLNQRTKADDTCAKAVVKEMFTAAKTLQSETGDVGGVDLASLYGIEQSITADSCGAGTSIAISDPATGAPGGTCPPGTSVSAANAHVGFCVSAQSQSGSWMTITEKSGLVSRTCEVPSGETVPYGACKGNGGTTGNW